MDVTEEQALSVLTEALTGYLQTLELDHRLEESSQPRQGKGNETSLDITRRQHFRSRTMATQTCLRFASRIASNVQKWVVGDEEPERVYTPQKSPSVPVWHANFLEEDEELETGYTPQKSPSILVWHANVPEEDEEPYLNPFTGQWIEPRTSKTAGPSNEYDIYAEKEPPIVSKNTGSSFDYGSEINAILFRNTSPNKSASQTGTAAKCEDNNFLIYSNFGSSVTSVESPDDSRQLARTFDNNFATGNPFDEVADMSNITSHSSGMITKGSFVSTKWQEYSMETMSPEHANFDFDLDDNKSRTSNLEAEWKSDHDLFDDQLRYVFGLEDGIPISQFDRDRVEAQKLQTQFETEQNYYSHAAFDVEDSQLLQQAKYARELFEADERKAQEYNQAMQDARDIHDQWVYQDMLVAHSTATLRASWEREQSLLDDQAAFATRASQEEDERDAIFQRDMAAARAARKQEEENAARERNQRFADELQRAEEEEERRIAAEIAEAEKREREREEHARRVEEERVRRVQVARQRAEDLERRRIAAEAVRVERQARERAQLARMAEVERQRLEQEQQEAERRARQAPCASCMEQGEKPNMCVLACQHAYCGECISGAFNSASQSRAPFKCCGNDAPVSLANRWLSAAFIAAYELLVLELSTRNPRYCSNRSCHRFIPPQNIRGPIATCPSCSTRSCSSCGQAEHAGVCAEDRDGMAVQAMAARQGWKACLRCSAMVERTDGCLHMTCRCGGQFCYVCGRDWSTCGGTCPR